VTGGDRSALSKGNRVGGLPTLHACGLRRCIPCEGLGEVRSAAGSRLRRASVGGSQRVQKRPISLAQGCVMHVMAAVNASLLSFGEHECRSAATQRSADREPRAPTSSSVWKGGPGPGGVVHALETVRGGGAPSDGDRDRAHRSQPPSAPSDPPARRTSTWPAVVSE
jgi:hypothetical protein